jgi:MFS family permease
MAKIELKSISKLYHLFLVILLASSSYFFGYYLSIFNPLATPMLKQVFLLTDETTPTFNQVQGNIHSLPGVTAFMTLAFFGSSMTVRWGRLKTIIIGEFLSMFTAASFLLIDYFESNTSKIYCLYVVRLLSGVVIAINTSCGQLLIREMMYDGWLEVGHFLTFVFLGGASFIAFAMGRIYTEKELYTNWKFILSAPSIFSFFRMISLYVAWVYKNKGHGRPGIESVKWAMERYWFKGSCEVEANGISENDGYRKKAIKEMTRLLKNLYTCDNLDLKIKEIIMDFES